MADRSSKWTFILYPSSAPSDWLDILKLSFVPFCCSPVHSPEDSTSGDELKQHIHVFLDYDSLKSKSQVESLTKTLNGTEPFIVSSPSGLYRYLIHADNPEKEQFKEGFNAIQKYNGFISDKYEKYSEQQLDGIYADICRIIDDNNITEFSTLIELVLNPEFDKLDYFRILRHNTIYFNSYISSRRNRIKKQDIEKLNNKIVKLQNQIEDIKHGTRSNE